MSHHPHFSVTSGIDAAILAAATGLPRTPLLLALSGGLDSMVLLDALARLSASGALPHPIRAAHVHHGLSPNADAWLAHCAAACAERSIPFDFRRVKVVRASQTSLEESARHARRAALTGMAGTAPLVFAHHQDDLAETLLLQLLRGAGPRGLAAMAVWQKTGGFSCWRPLLSLTRSDLAAYATEHRLKWIEDESNDDVGFKRNFLRHRVLPVLEEAFPAYRKTLARAAGLQAEAVTLLNEHALPMTAQFPLEQKVFAALSPENARHVLRQALSAAGLTAPPLARVSEMVRQLQNARPDARTALAHQNHCLGIYAGMIHCYQPVPAYTIRWCGEAVIPLPHGTLHCRTGVEHGLRIDPAVDKVLICSRRFARETLKRAQRPRRALGDLLREAQLPQWLRDPYPRVWVNDALACVPNLGIAETHETEDTSGVSFEFVPTLG